MEQQDLRAKETEPTVGATDGVGHIRELLVRAAHGVRWLRQGPGWMGVQWVGRWQALSEYRLGWFPSEDSWDVGLLKACSSRVPTAWRLS